MTRGALPLLSDFPYVCTENIRYNDTDRQGHVNNAVYATYLESGRVDWLDGPSNALQAAGANFVLAHLVMDYRQEVLWPGQVQIGTRIQAMGRSSLTMAQAVFAQGVCCLTATSTIVLVDLASKRARPLPDATRALVERELAATASPPDAPQAD